MATIKLNKGSITKGNDEVVFNQDLIDNTVFNALGTPQTNATIKCRKFEFYLIIIGYITVNQAVHRGEPLATIPNYSAQRNYGFTAYNRTKTQNISMIIHTTGSLHFRQEDEVSAGDIVDINFVVAL